MRLVLKWVKRTMALLVLIIMALGGTYYAWVKPKTDYPLLHVNVIANLHKYVQETSSLAYFSGQYWTTNDSGDGPYLYRINPDRGKIEGTVKLLSSNNTDWESLAQDSENLYVFDCGNNKANRKSRVIMQVAFTALDSAKYDKKNDAVVEIVNKRRFTMADSPDNLVPFVHDFDCEAAAAVEDELWIFSKNWTDFESRLYRLPLSEMAVFSEVKIPLYPELQISVNGLLTGADYNHNNNQLVLLGYDNDIFYKQAFVWFIPVKGKSLNWSLAKRFNLDVRGQWESIIWKNNTELLITAEATFDHNARIATLAVPLL